MRITAGSFLKAGLPDRFETTKRAISGVSTDVPWVPLAIYKFTDV
jgi:hypothetical protein